MEKILAKYDENFLNVAKPIIEHEEYQKMRFIPHHHNSVFEHCLDVAYLSYRISSRLKLDTTSTIRGALLHDFYLFKFKKRENKNIIAEGYRHSRNHPKIAKDNALKFFDLNEKEIDIISNHMFPVGLPRCYEAWVTSLADKTFAIMEYSTRMYYYTNVKVGRYLFPKLAKEIE